MFKSVADDRQRHPNHRHEGGRMAERGTATDSRRAATREQAVGVVVVDDQLVFRQVARAVIAMTPGFELLGEAPSGEEAIAAVSDLHPDLVLLDVRMPGMDGIETTGHLHSVD